MFDWVYIPVVRAGSLFTRIEQYLAQGAPGYSKEMTIYLITSSTRPESDNDKVSTIRDAEVYLTNPDALAPDLKVIEVPIMAFFEPNAYSYEDNPDDPESYIFYSLKYMGV